MVTPTSQWPHLRLLIIHTDHDDVRFRGSFPILTDKNDKLAYFGVLESLIYSTFCGTWGLLSYMYVCNFGISDPFDVAKVSPKHFSLFLFCVDLPERDSAGPIIALLARSGRALT